ncbi:PREDICTED: SWI/SNF-related matrix-associated actin-dependent regulator of chromatin subfamily A-like protein 1 [Bactrocera latifrons]|uniref:SWI/SNF-related matrix-associated actin-dependent regulator of chromatin subfamily A-like protein 1 n=1 Tax=Bactrocera latifrons TaxID=174628 RepID=A0A0K8VIJ5_BACLA|nr:PREDICTED: SWI/SNF-related matrix-associated actin-dependent regulator of chromatin subfamily A-like protein 1 [Bactrocera latifrons]
MSVCTAAEIAEKRRIALEKLAAKKQRLANASSTATKITSPVQQQCTATGAISTNSFFKQQNHTQTQSDANAKLQQNSSAKPSAAAINFLNDLKRSNIGKYVNNARNSAQPYPRSPFHNKPNAAAIQTVSNVNQQNLAPVFAVQVSCKVYMISNTRFVAQPSCYHAKLIDVFKTIPSRSYDNLKCTWSFGLQDYELLQERVGGMKPDVSIGTIPKSVISVCRTPPVEIEHSCLSSIEPKLAQKLLPFQQEGVCFAIAHHGRLMICDEMGLGKTYQALAVADFYKESWPLLICTTASVRESWVNHVRDLLPSIHVHYIQTLLNNQQYFHDAKVLITSYNMMDKHVDRLLEHKFGFVIFDESHTLKNAKTKCSMAAERLTQKARHVILLSGTPALSRPLELFTQIHLIDRKFMTFKEYTTRYCDGKQTHFGWDATGQSNLEELNVVLKEKFMIRRTKDSVLPQLAEKNRETVLLDPALLSINTVSKQNLETLSRDFSTSKGREREDILLRFYSTTAEVKARAVCAYLKNLVKDKIKFIVFAHHRVMLDAISDCLCKLNVNFIRIDGTTKNEARGEYIEKFQTKSSCQVAVLSLRACNAGITLTAAEMIIFAELDWNPSTLAQAESRAHRIGQNKAIICRYLMAPKTADDAIWNMLKNKQDVLNRAGLFCENLQDATHTAAPTGSHKIENYFSPMKKVDPPKSSTTADVVHIKPQPAAGVVDDAAQKLDLSKELENIDEFFMDDDDDAFKDLMF